jgi:hypothetical protein
MQGAAREQDAIDNGQHAATETLQDHTTNDTLDLSDLNNVLIVSAPTPERLAKILEAVLSRERRDLRPFMLVDGKGATVDEPVSGLEIWRPTWVVFDDNPKGLPKPSEVRERIREMWPSSFGDLTTSPDGMSPRFCWNTRIPRHVQLAFYSRNLEGGLVAARQRGLERIDHPYRGRVWYVCTRCTPRETAYLTVRGTCRIVPKSSGSNRDRISTISLDQIALVMNYCQTVNGHIIRTTFRGHQFYPGSRFFETYVNPDWQLDLTYLGIGYTGAPPSSKSTVDLVMQWHVRSLILDHGYGPMPETIPMDPGVVLHRQQAILRGSRKSDEGSPSLVPLIENVYSTSLCILNTDEAPYTVLVLADELKTLNRPGTLARVLEPVTEGIVLDGRCAGLAHFMLLMLKVFSQWENDWLETLNAIDGVSEFRVCFILPSAVCTSLTSLLSCT